MKRLVIVLLIGFVLLAEVNYRNALAYSRTTDGSDLEISEAMASYGLTEDPSFLDKLKAVL